MESFEHSFMSFYVKDMNSHSFFFCIQGKPGISPPLPLPISRDLCILKNKNCSCLLLFFTSYIIIIVEVIIVLIIIILLIMMMPSRHIECFLFRWQFIAESCFSCLLSKYIRSLDQLLLTLWISCLFYGCCYQPHP